MINSINTGINGLNLDLPAMRMDVQSMIEEERSDGERKCLKNYLEFLEGGKSGLEIDTNFLSRIIPKQKFDWLRVLNQINQAINNGQEVPAGGSDLPVYKNLEEGSAKPTHISTFDYTVEDGGKHYIAKSYKIENIKAEERPIIAVILQKILAEEFSNLNFIKVRKLMYVENPSIILVVYDIRKDTKVENVENFIKNMMKMYTRSLKNPKYESLSTAFNDFLDKKKKTPREFKDLLGSFESLKGIYESLKKEKVELVNGMVDKLKDLLKPLIFGFLISMEIASNKLFLQRGQIKSPLDLKVMQDSEKLFKLIIMPTSHYKFCPKKISNGSHILPIIRKLEALPTLLEGSIDIDKHKEQHETGIKEFFKFLGSIVELSMQVVIGEDRYTYPWGREAIVGAKKFLNEKEEDRNYLIKTIWPESSPSSDETPARGPHQSLHIRE